MGVPDTESQALAMNLTLESGIIALLAVFGFIAFVYGATRKRK